MSIVKISKEREREAIQRLAADVHRRQEPDPIGELRAENERLRALLTEIKDWMASEDGFDIADYALDGPTEWPPVWLYREILAALASETKEETNVL